MQAPHPTVPPDAWYAVAWDAKVIRGRKLVLDPKQAGKAVVLECACWRRSDEHNLTRELQPILAAE